MGRNIFISYKYKDDKIQSLNKTKWQFINGSLLEFPRPTIVRDYVDELQSVLKEEHINLGEKDGESLADFKESTIETSLKKKIFQSSVTIVIISRGMIDFNVPEKDQWIPWEVSYSLKTLTRADNRSRMNAVLGIVLPDEYNSYDWYYTEHNECNCTTHHTEKLFDILRNNMFNEKYPNTRDCNGLQISLGECSFIKTVKWHEFLISHGYYIEKSVEIRNNEEAYKIRINLS